MYRALLTAISMMVSQTVAAADAPAGVSRPDLAWQHWALNCQGCHRTDGSGSPETAPPLVGVVAKFTNVAGGREYLARVPGVATSPLSDAELAELLNWMLWRFDRSHLQPNFRPFSAEEVGALRSQPLRTEAARIRARLIGKIDHVKKSDAHLSPLS
jgi:cytochrome c553